MWLKVNMIRELPCTCSFCNKQAVAVIFYNYLGFLSRYSGQVFLCEKHFEEIKKLRREELEDVLLGKMSLE